MNHTHSLLPDERQPPAVRLCHLALSEGLAASASAVRFEPDPKAGSVAFEVSGGWKEVMMIPVPAYGAVVSHLKSMAGLIAARLPAQQGSMQLQGEARSAIATLAVRDRPDGEQVIVQFS